VYVVNPPSNSVTVYDESGNLLKTRGGFPGLNTPTSITFDAADQLLYVLSRDNRGYCCSVVAYTTEGNQVASCDFHVDGDVYGTAAFDSSTQLLYVFNSAFNEEAQVTGFALAYDRSGRRVSTGGSFSVFGGLLTSLVADPKNHRIYITAVPDPSFEPGGGVVLEFDQDGNQVQLYYPQFSDVQVPSSITFDSANNELYVVNHGGFAGNMTKPVTAFDQTGNEIAASGSFNVMYPNSIAFDAANRLLYVTSDQGNAIKAFDENGDPVPTPGGFPGLKDPTSLVVVP
jgi:DNA-binding beta-propeller fold protein YncE